MPSTSSNIIPFADSATQQQQAIQLLKTVGSGIDRDDLDPHLLAFGLQHQLIREVLPTVPRGHTGPLPPVRVHLTGTAMETSQQLQSAGHLLFDAQITRYGLTITRDLTLDQWRTLITNLRRVKECYHAALADSITYGRTKFGREIADQHIEQLEFPFEDVKHAESIAHVSRLTRETFQLTSEHTYILGLMFPDDTTSQELWGARCHEHRLTPLALRRSIEAGVIITDADLKTRTGANSGRPVLQGMTLPITRWIADHGGREKLLKLPVEQKVEIIRELQDIIELGLALRESLGDLPED